MLGYDHRPRFKEDRQNRCGIDTSASCSAVGIVLVLVVVENTMGTQRNRCHHGEVCGAVFMRLVEFVNALQNGLAEPTIIP